MKLKNVSRWLLLLLIVLTALMYFVRSGSTREYYEFQGAFSSLSPGQTVLLSEHVTLGRGLVFLWVRRESGISRSYFLLPNACTHIPFNLASVHDSSIARVEVTVCNIGGSLYYRVPIVP